MNWIKIDSKNETSRQEHTHTKTTSARRQPKLGDWTKSILEKRQSNYKNLELKEFFYGNWRSIWGPRILD